MNICLLFEELLWEGQTQGYHRRTKYFLTNAVGYKVYNSSDRCNQINVLISIIGLVYLKMSLLCQHLKCNEQIPLIELIKKYSDRKFRWILLLVVLVKMFLKSSSLPHLNWFLACCTKFYRDIVKFVMPCTGWSRKFC
jgi:hypothetical protein